MTFVSAAFLFAALAGAIPVVLHMINRQQAKNLPFSTLRFLRISAEKTRRRKRIHDLLLMLLRVAVLILLAFGLAEPTLT
ncbi:MAG: BatA domain-containing protein, partial [Planctomycetota bacterium]|nr:BatA domain-containing protein [Planctomycetota bacterium]